MNDIYEKILKNCTEMMNEMSKIGRSNDPNKLKSLFDQYTDIQSLINAYKISIAKYKSVMKTLVNKHSLNKENNTKNSGLNEKILIVQKNLDNVSSKYQQLINNNLRNNKIEISSNKKIYLEEDKDQDDDENLISFQKQKQNKFYRQKMTEEIRHLEEMNKEFDEILKTSNQMKEISNGMLEEMLKQGEKISTIEDNIITTNFNLINSNKELKKTEEKLDLTNKFCRWITVLMLLVFFLAFVIFFYISKKTEN